MAMSNDVDDRTPDRAEVAEVRPGEQLDWDAVAVFLRSAVPGLDGELTVEQFPNGSANLTYRLTMGDRRMVLRRPPFGQLAPGAHDMRREHRALAGLSTVFDRVARPLAFCDDHSVIGSDFFVMEYRPGVVIWDHIPAAMSHHTDVGRRVGFAVADTLADLHLLDPSDAGLADLGRPIGFVERQVSGWSTRWSLVDAGRVPTMNDVSRRLLDSLPPQSAQVSILHNDVKLDNCQFSPDDPDRVKTVFDWDMATLGDPLVDLGTLMNYWPDPRDSDDDRSMHVPGLECLGLPGRPEMIERYAARTGFDVSHLPWYEAFATWKTAVVCEQLYQRWVRGESTDARMADRGEPVPRLCDRAATLLDRLSA
jgi:aminoglycoside phosphotransferase (APT) family kinase protein